MANKEVEEFYTKLKSELEKTTVFPAEYLYKFILPTGEDKKAAIRAVFATTTATIEEKPSSSGKYTAYSIRLKVQNPDEVIAYYKEAGKIEGIISL
ncbi:DUF493 family protein [Capnocytophaga gingivalis]|jgi:hypothetical protein|uniref:DUF493 family protein n=1 Tax=Capnocytophaga gingivalis TaxID=1017 RepID=A0ABU5Z5Y0_9FLAO|nr:DUF493 family protein [Capnocytophaga gingivalis]MEB3074113.1 DUF493 family protein [Capnocytophaga gingivalis]